MGPGRVTTTGDGSMAVVESAQRRTQGSLQLLARGAGPQEKGRQGLEQAMSGRGRQSCKTEQGVSPRRKPGHEDGSGDERLHREPRCLHTYRAG